MYFYHWSFFIHECNECCFAANDFGLSSLWFRLWRSWRTTTLAVGRRATSRSAVTSYGINQFWSSRKYEVGSNSHGNESKRFRVMASYIQPGIYCSPDRFVKFIPKFESEDVIHFMCVIFHVVQWIHCGPLVFCVRCDVFFTICRWEVGKPILNLGVSIIAHVANT